MKKVFLFSVLLISGLAASQTVVPMLQESHAWLGDMIRFLTMLCLGFIMIHVGYEFDIDRSRLRTYALDYGVAATAAAFPWIFCAAYFVFAMRPESEWWTLASWKESLLAGRFAAPTSAGILFAMLAAAGLSATWMFRKARILAIFDDLDTVLLMIPLKMLLVGVKWQLGIIVLSMAVLVWIAWKYMHRIRIPIVWPWVLAYAAGIAFGSEVIYRFSKLIDEVVPIHIEVLLPAFVLGCVLARPQGQDPHSDDAKEGHQDGPESPEEQRISTIISACFMILVGLSMPMLSLEGSGGWGQLATHVLLLTLLANIGKMFPLICYRTEASWRERLALCIGMWPRGEVGAGVLIVSISYGLRGEMIAAAALSLALNLVLTGAFILVVKKLLSSSRADLTATA